MNSTRIKTLAKKAGIDVSLYSMGSGSLVRSGECHGVARADFETFAKHCYDEGFHSVSELVEIAKEHNVENAEWLRLQFKYGDLTLGQLYALCDKLESAAASIGKGSEGS
jgi:hypothetical protein